MMHFKCQNHNQYRDKVSTNNNKETVNPLSRKLDIASLLLALVTLIGVFVPGIANNIE